jgi:glutamate dehydrogenase
MSGDVFGNGMLHTRTIKLLAAFDHRHLFIDPDPEPETSYEERKRLFEMAGSSWADYNRALISDGGGVYPRTLKSVQLSAEARAALGIRAESLTPAELIRKILCAPVDLLWNGGIGTYVRARGESDGDVGDRSNDTVRVTASALRCRVVGEGGNLGLSQLARIEYARQGGRIDTDFIHNAGGVNCSDHEVNIKILLDQAVADGDLTLKQRNRLLEQMTDEVARLVLRDSYWQNRCLGLEAFRARQLLPEHARFMRYLEQHYDLDRALEFLPDDEALSEREAEGEGLTRPEIALLVSYAKHSLYQDLLASELPGDPCLAPELERYFPTPLRETFHARIHDHRLRREILASSLANRIVNRLGSTFVFRLREELGVDTPSTVRAYVATWEILGMRRLWSAIAELDGQLAYPKQQEILWSAVRLMSRSSRWLLKSCGGPIAIAACIERYRGRIEELGGRMCDLVDAAHREGLTIASASLQEAGLPEDLAAWVASFDLLSRAFDVVEVAETCETEACEAARVYFALGASLELDWLARRILALPTQDRWFAEARAGLRDDLLRQHRALSVAVLTQGMTSTSAASKLEAWRRQNPGAVDTWLRLLAELKAQEEPDLARLSVALRALQKLALTTSRGGA